MIQRCGRVRAIWGLSLVIASLPGERCAHTAVCCEGWDDAGLKLGYWGAVRAPHRCPFNRAFRWLSLDARHEQQFGAVGVRPVAEFLASLAC